MYKILSWLQPCSHTVRIVNPSGFTRISRSSVMILQVICTTDQNVPIIKDGKNRGIFLGQMDFNSILGDSIISHKTRFVL